LRDSIDGEDFRRLRVGCAETQCLTGLSPDYLAPPEALRFELDAASGSRPRRRSRNPPLEVAYAEERQRWFDALLTAEFTSRSMIGDFYRWARCGYPNRRYSKRGLAKRQPAAKKNFAEPFTEAVASVTQGTPLNMQIVQ
jgi:hypothetical protein